MTSIPHSADVSGAEFHAQVIQRSAQVPVVVDFWAAWCAPCRALLPVLTALAEQANGAFFLARVDTEAEQETAAAFGIRSLPTVKLFRDGQVVDEFMGALPEAEVRRWLKPHLPRPADGEVQTASAALGAGDYDAAIQHFEAALAADAEDERAVTGQIEALIRSGRADDAQQRLAQLPIQLAGGEQAAALQALLGFAQAAAAPADGDSAATYARGARQALAGDYDAAVADFLELVRHDRGFGDDAGRKALVAVFALLGNDPRVARYRSQLAMAIN
ncbi:MAG: tetratricopeptide repeat protein [Gammaproteobacteria bacterium]|nr:tetratricopeptide repeat protein [Gammaproteobacteria bacterium]